MLIYNRFSKNYFSMKKLNDPLRFIYKMTLDAIDYKIMQFFLTLTFVLHSFVSVAFILELTLTFDADLLVTYGPIIFTFGSGIGGFLVVYKIRRTLKLLLQKCKLPAPDSKSQMLERIKRESKIILNAVYFDNILMIVTVLFHWPIIGENNNIYYATVLFEKVVPSFSSKLCVLYYLSLFFIVYLVAMNPYLLLYTSTYIKFQLCYINELLTNIDAKWSKFGDYQLMRNNVYQEMISEELKKCIDRHRLFQSLVKELNNLIYIPLLILMSLAILAIVSILFNIIVKRQETFYCRVCSTLLFALLTLSFAIISGQLIENEWKKLIERAFCCRWISWNFENRRTLLIFFMNAQRPSRIGNAFIRCEYSFLLTAGRFVCSLCAFFFQLARIREEEMLQI
ncbi:odorant receptor 320 [Tribolium castaneum]|uniref:Odorant receptor n=1 Tax=Tribolium castaneum TaxID=7070 RepID=D6W9T8_TRICA|nr:odorant receptor 320 [Tribolium castaneum]